MIVTEEEKNQKPNQKYSTQIELFEIKKVFFFKYQGSVNKENFQNSEEETEGHWQKFWSKYL